MSDYQNNRFSGNYGSGQRNNQGAAPSNGYGGGNRGGYNGAANRSGYSNGGGGSQGQGGNRGNWGNRQQNLPIDPDPYIPVGFFSNAEPPLDVKEKFKALSEKLASLKFTIRVAGGNSEADDAARDAAGEKLEEYLPWKGFENRESQYSFADESSIEQACKFHPAADKMKEGAKKFLSRNLRLLQGKGNKSPVKFMIVWSEDGAQRLSEKNFKTGAIGHILSIAAGTKTRVFNIGKPGVYDDLMKFLDPEKEPEYKPRSGPNGDGQSRPQYQNQGDRQNYRDNNNYREEKREPEPAKSSNDDDGEISSNDDYDY